MNKKIKSKPGLDLSQLGKAIVDTATKPKPKKKAVRKQP